MILQQQQQRQQQRQRPVDIRWKGPTTPRAKPIAPAKWEEHKEKLYDLFRTMTMGGLTATMTVKHGFTPSRRQYVSQFEKWGWRKYKTTDEGALQSESNVHSSQQLSGANGTAKYMNGYGDRPELLSADYIDTNFDTGRRPGKRPLEPSGGPATPPPPEKRQKASVSPNNSVSGTDGHFVTATHRPGLPQDSSDRAIPEADTNRKAMLSELPSNFEPGQSDFERWARQKFPASSMPQQERRADINRPLDMFSLGDILEMKRKADFYFCEGWGEFSFPLYVQIFKLLRTYDGPAWMISWARIACTRSASTLSQVEVVESILAQVAEVPLVSAADIEAVMIRTALVNFYNRLGQTAAARDHAKAVLAWHKANASPLTNLPPGNRSLDLFAYSNLVQNHELGGFVEETVVHQLKKQFQLDKIKTILLELEPGPFELKNGCMQISTLRSCLEWCLEKLELAAAGEDTDIYLYLWESSHLPQAEDLKPELTLWKSQAERLMGISSTELLQVVHCMMVVAPGPIKKTVNKQFRVRDSVSRRAKYLSQLSDKYLGHRFLNSFLAFLDRYQFRILLRKWEMNHCESELGIMLPPAISPQSKPSSDSGGHWNTNPKPDERSEGAVRGPDVPLQTLAPSLHSSDLSSFRRLRDRISRNVRGGADNKSMTSLSKWSSSSALTSMSDLSGMLASSLNLASARRSSMSISPP